MKNDETILVIMPMYNAELFIKKSIESILNQKGVKIILVVIDDGSTDDSYKIASSFSNIVLLSNKNNKGTYVSINRGLHHMRKNKDWNYYCIHGADDFSYPNRFFKQISKFSKNIIGVSCSSIRKNYHTNKTIRVNRKTTESQLIFKREVFNKIGYYDNVRAGADTEYKRRVSLAFSNKITSINEILLQGNYHGKNLTRVIPLGGRWRNNYVNKFSIKHKKMKSSKNYYQGFK